MFGVHPGAVKMSPKFTVKFGCTLSVDKLGTGYVMIFYLNHVHNTYTYCLYITLIHNTYTESICVLNKCIMYE